MKVEDKEALIALADKLANEDSCGTFHSPIIGKPYIQIHGPHNANKDSYDLYVREHVQKQLPPGWSIDRVQVNDINRIIVLDRPVNKPAFRPHILQFFDYDHLPEELQAVSAPFHNLANAIVENLPHNPESSTALRKLLEAKDAAVRAKLAK